MSMEDTYSEKDHEEPLVGNSHTTLYSISLMLLFRRHLCHMLPSCSCNITHNSLSPHISHVSHVQTCNSRDISLDHLLASLHLRKKFRITNNPCSVFDLSAGLIQPRDDSHDSAFKYIRQVGDVLETHAARPLIHHFHQAEPGTRDKIIRVV